MPSADDLHGQIQLVCQYFHSRVGHPLTRYETAAILTHDEMWEPWNDLPIRLHIGPGAPVDVVWMKFCELWIECAEPVPFWQPWVGDGCRWVPNARPAFEPLRGGKLRAACLGRDTNLAPNDLAFNEWNRFLLEFDRGWLEVFNALDENGYAVHAARPDGEWVRCA
jgi:hypothetical protein